MRLTGIWFWLLPPPGHLSLHLVPEQTVPFRQKIGGRPYGPGSTWPSSLCASEPAKGLSAAASLRGATGGALAEPTRVIPAVHRVDSAPVSTMYLGGNLFPTQVRETGIVLAGASGASGSAHQVPRPCTSSVPLASASVWWCSLPCPLDCNLTPAPASLRYPPSRVSNLRHLSTSLFPSHPLYFLPIPPLLFRPSSIRLPLVRFLFH